MLKIVTIPEGRLTGKQANSIGKLAAECFGRKWTREEQEAFYVKPFAKVIAYSDGNVIGVTKLFKRKVEFDDRKVVLGGIGGVCVAKKARGKGIATAMLRKALAFLKANDCDVACLFAGKPKQRIYRKLGFKSIMKVSYQDIRGRIRYEKDAMFIPIKSKKIHSRIMRSKKTFHVGKGIW